jgi:hypothetical protein
MTWNTVASASGAIASLILAVIALLQRPKVSRWFLARRVLIERNAVLAALLAAVRLDNERLSEQLDSAIKSGTYSREELDSIIDRVSELSLNQETMMRRQAESDNFIRGAIPYMAALEIVLVKHGISLPDGVKRPIIPAHLLLSHEEPA